MGSRLRLIGEQDPYVGWETVFLEEVCRTSDAPIRRSPDSQVGSRIRLAKRRKESDDEPEDPVATFGYLGD
jgi:hypothetical protein